MKLTPHFFKPEPDRICSDKLHGSTMQRTYEQTPGQHPTMLIECVKRVTLDEIKEAKYTGTANFVVDKFFDLKMAIDSDNYASCGLRIDGHAHLAKNEDNEQEDVLAAGEVGFEEGKLHAISNDSGTNLPPGIGEPFGEEHKNQAVKGVEY